jgi:ParB family chromosome partitioning protein
VPKAGRPSTSDDLFDRVLNPGHEVDATQITNVFTRLIQPNPRQPRKEINPDAFEMLVASIREKGIQHPLLVRPFGRQYELVAGQRRLLAAQRLDLTEVPVVIRELSDVDALAAAIIENLTREELNPIDETDAILQLLGLELDRPVDDVITLLYRMQRTLRGGAHNVMGADEEVVERVFGGLGKMTWASFVQNRLPVLGYPEDLLEAVRSGKLAYTKARELTRVTNADTRKELLERAIGETLSLPNVKKLVASHLAGGESQAPADQRLALLRRQLSPKRLDRLEALKRKEVEALLEQLHALLAD